MNFILDIIASNLIGWDCCKERNFKKLSLPATWMRFFVIYLKSLFYFTRNLSVKHKLTLRIIIIACALIIDRNSAIYLYERPDLGFSKFWVITQIHLFSLSWKEGQKGQTCKSAKKTMVRGKDRLFIYPFPAFLARSIFLTPRSSTEQPVVQTTLTKKVHEWVVKIMKCSQIRILHEMRVNF